jgi:hypothetical protein
MLALMQEFAAWLLMLPEARAEAGLPARQRGVAELLGVSEATLSVWKKDKRFQQMVGHQVRADFSADRLGKVITALFETATETRGASQVSAAKTLLTWFEKDIGPEATIDYSALSDEELNALPIRDSDERTTG